MSRPVKIKIFMHKKSLNEAIHLSFSELLPFSKKFKVDLRRYLFTIKLLDKILNGVEGKRILDVGTGIGIVPLALKILGAHPTGVDYYVFPENQNAQFAVEEIGELRKIWEKHGIKILNANIYGADNIFEKFDAAVSEATIEHLKNPKMFLENIRASIKQGGIFLLSTPNLATLLKRLRFMAGLSPNWPVSDFYKSGESFTGHWREYTMKELKWMCREAGFKIIETRNKNLLASFKHNQGPKKHLRAFVQFIAGAVPGSREMNYLVCKK